MTWTSGYCPRGIEKEMGEERDWGRKRVTKGLRALDTTRVGQLSLLHFPLGCFAGNDGCHWRCWSAMIGWDGPEALEEGRNG